MNLLPRPGAAPLLYSISRIYTSASYWWHAFFFWYYNKKNKNKIGYTRGWAISITNPKIITCVPSSPLGFANAPQGVVPPVAKPWSSIYFGCFSIPSTQTRDSRTWIYGLAYLEVQTSEDGSTHLQLEQQRTRWNTISALLTVLYGLM